MKVTRHDDFVDHVCELLAPLGDVRPRAMFGGHGVYVDDVFCAIVAFDTLYFKVDDGNRADFVTRGCRPFKPSEDKATVLSYYEAPAEVVDDRRAMLDWGRKAIEAARRSGTRRAARQPSISSPAPASSPRR